LGFGIISAVYHPLWRGKLQTCFKKYFAWVSCFFLLSSKKFYFL